jgi:hypothetical protein
VNTLTDAGRAVLAGWVSEPTPASRLRDEFFLKLVLAGSSGIADPRALIEQQRREYLLALRALGEANGEVSGTVASLLAEGTALHLEADLRWLDLCESRLVREER